jgi:hypothetical protein
MFKLELGICGDGGDVYLLVFSWVLRRFMFLITRSGVLIMMKGVLSAVFTNGWLSVLSKNNICWRKQHEISSYSQNISTYSASFFYKLSTKDNHVHFGGCGKEETCKHLYVSCRVAPSPKLLERGRPKPNIINTKEMPQILKCKCSLIDFLYYLFSLRSEVRDSVQEELQFFNPYIYFNEMFLWMPWL